MNDCSSNTRDDIPIENIIAEKLCEIEVREQLRILYAVESGSRAWGVASPDSDYDVRFVYLRPLDGYLKLEKTTDVIEWQLDEVLDINGWDLKKALQQFHKGNATLFEWGRSPVVYKTTKAWERIWTAAKEYFSEKAALYHYWASAKNTYLHHLIAPQVMYKKYIYALRPLLACRYIEETHSIPPVLFSELAGQCLPQYLKQETAQLLEVKSLTKEQALHPPLPGIQDYIKTELERLEGHVKAMPDDRNPDWEKLDQIFKEHVVNQ